MCWVCSVKTQCLHMIALTCGGLLWMELGLLVRRREMRFELDRREKG